MYLILAPNLTKGVSNPLQVYHNHKTYLTDFFSLSTL